MAMRYAADLAAFRGLSVACRLKTRRVTGRLRRPATKEELLGFFNHIEAELEQLGFFNPSHRRATVVRNLRTMFSRMGATEQEVRTLRGIVATLAKGKGNARKSSI